MNDNDREPTRLADPEHPISTAADNFPPESSSAPETAPAAVDARQFGILDRAGGWGPALLVARSVHPDTADAVGDRLSLTRFAELAGIEADRVEQHYRAWQEAADAGIVPAAETLESGVEVGLPPAEWWKGFFEVAGETPPEVAEPAPTAAEEPAPEEEPTPAEIPVAETVIDRLAQDAELRADLTREFGTTPELRKAVNAEATRNNRLGFVQTIADSETWQVAKEHAITIPAQVRSTAAEKLAVLNAPGATPADVDEAYRTVRSLLAETVEADPEISARQQREKLRKAIKAATTRVESLPETAVAPILDEQLVGEIRRLVDKLSAVVGQEGA